MKKTLKQLKEEALEELAGFWKDHDGFYNRKPYYEEVQAFVRASMDRVVEELEGIVPIKHVSDDPESKEVEFHVMGWNAARSEMLKRIEQFSGEGGRDKIN